MKSKNGDDPLAKIAEGAGLVFLSSLFGLGCAFIARLVIVRIGTESQYGIFSLAFAVLNIFSIIGALGLIDGVARHIAFARGHSNDEKVREFVIAAVLIGIIASSVLSIAVWFLADYLARVVFKNASIVFALRIFSVGIPLFTMLNIFVSIFRGFENIKPKIYFQDVFRNVIFLLLIIVTLIAGLSFNYVYYSFVTSLGVSFIAITVYSRIKSQFSIQSAVLAFSKTSTRELLLFSFPLLGVSILQMVIAWTDTLMIGGYCDERQVGLYNAAYPLAQFITLPMTSFALIYVPVISNLYAVRGNDAVRENFSIVVKWLCYVTLPFFIFLFLFPEQVLNLMFGPGYEQGADALRILCVGFILDSLMGMSGPALIGLGRTKFIMWATLITTVLNIVLNAVLIPKIGIEGSAIASACALSLVGLLRCWKLFVISKANPLSANLIKPTLLSFTLILIIYFVFLHTMNIVWWMLILIGFLFYVVYIFGILVTKSIGVYDLSILSTLYAKIGVNADSLKKVIRKFSR